MADTDRKRLGGAKLARSEVVTVRLDPKLRYLAELAARKQRRTLSSFIEWAIEDTLARFPLKEGPDWMTSVLSESENLWDVDEADRFAKLALKFPELLSHEEQITWKLVRECGYLWRGKYVGPKKEWTWQVTESSLNFERLREHWDTFKRVANGQGGTDTLPTWKKALSGGFDDMDDEIPF